MKTGWLLLISTFLWLILPLTTLCQHQADGAQAPESIPAKSSAEPAVMAKNPLPKISFESTLCDLGQIAQGTNNICEFKFTNTGQAPLKITNVKRTCGCTVFKLDKTDFAPGQAGTIKVTYTAPKSP